SRLYRRRSVPGADAASPAPPANPATAARPSAAPPRPPPTRTPPAATTPIRAPLNLLEVFLNFGVVLSEVVLGFDRANLISCEWNSLGELWRHRNHHSTGRNECSARQCASQNRTTVHFHDYPAP